MRADHDLATLLTYENIAWYETGCVRILDRRVYPAKERYVMCTTYGEVTEAIKTMVTQSYGPFHAACMGMALAAYECRNQTADAQKHYLMTAADVIANARPTTARKMHAWTDDCETAAGAAIDAGVSASEAILHSSVEKFNRRYERIAKIGYFLAERVPKAGTVMTQCYADTDLGMLLRALRETGKRDVRFFCPETRPYLQGARLTASVIFDMGFDVTLITDNMPGYTMKTKHVDVFTSAADVICMDGHVVNKVGTFQIALAADYLGVPYYVTGIPDITHPTIDTVQIEERDPEEVLHAMGVRTAKRGVKGYYPAFDITPPELVKGVVTDQGILDAKALSPD
ncbi:MAG: s-methyl-5-thioribose-1-phosphate isomerase [Clostridia bacterium]